MSDEFEFSRPYVLEKLGAGQDRLSIEAGASERAALAERLGLVAIARLSADLAVTADPVLKLVLVSGEIEAEVTQSCVVSLAPVVEQVSERFEQSYNLEASTSEDEDEDGPDPEAPEALPEGGLDLGEEVAQQLSLALNPYPRAPGATLPDSARDAKASPFAGLAQLGKASIRQDDDESQQ